MYVYVQPQFVRKLDRSQGKESESVALKTEILRSHSSHIETIQPMQKWKSRY